MGRNLRVFRTAQPDPCLQEFRVLRRPGRGQLPPSSRLPFSQKSPPGFLSRAAEVHFVPKPGDTRAA